MEHLFSQYLFLIFLSFGTSGRLCFVIKAFPGVSSLIFLHLDIFLLNLFTTGMCIPYSITGVRGD